MKSHVKSVLLGIAVLATAMIPFLRAWDYGLINLDDYFYLTQHPLVCDWQGLESLRHCLTDMREGIWMPLTYLSYALDWRLFGEWFGGFHLHAIFLHFLNSCLVLGLLRLLFPGRNALCLLAALIWAVHPLRCESVVYLASRKDLLSFFWEALALIAWIKASLLPDARRRRAIALTAVSFTCFVLGSMCKPSVMTFPLLCLLLDGFIVRRIRPLRYIAPVSYMLFLGAFAAIQQAAGGATADMFHQPLWGRLLGAAAAYGIYLKNFLWPQSLALQCLTRWPELPRFWMPGLVICAVIGWWLCKRLMPLWTDRRTLFTVSRENNLPVDIVCHSEPAPVLAGVLWFSIAIAPMLGIAHFGFHAFADRFTYIPALGLSIALIGILSRFTFTSHLNPILPLTFTFVFALSLACWRQTGFWRDDLTAFTHTLEVDGPRNAFAHTNVALWHFEVSHDLETVVREYETALKLTPGLVLPDYHIYAAALAELGQERRLAEQIRFFEKTLDGCFGREYAAKILSFDPSVGPKNLRLAEIYRYCKIAWFLCDASDLPSAKSMIEETETSPRFSNSRFLTYLKVLLARKSGDTAAADRLAAELVKPVRSDGFLQFRFLRQQ